MRSRQRLAGRPDDGWPPFRRDNLDTACFGDRSERRLEAELERYDALSDADARSALLRIGRDWTTYSEARAVSRGGDASPTRSYRAPRWSIEKLRICDGFVGAGAGARGREGNRGGQGEGAAPWGADRRQGSVLDQGRTDRSGHDDLSRLPPERGCDRRLQTQRGRCGHPRQTAINRRRLRRPSSVDRSAAQPVGCDALVGRIFERVRRRDCRGTLLRLAGIRHWRLDPLSVGRQRCDRPEANLGTGQPLRRFRTRRDAGPHRTPGAKCGGLTW